MSDTYQAVYDAVRSRISDPSHAIERAARDGFDTSHLQSVLRQEFVISAQEMARPSVLFRPVLSVDGDQYCALYGENLIEGCAGFGDTAAAAMIDFDTNWYKQKAVKISEALAETKEATP